MGLPKFMEQRKSLRKMLTGLMPGKMIKKGQNIALNVRPMDISKEGLGVIILESLDIGETLSLILKDSNVELEIMWKKVEFQKDNSFRYGLRSVDESINLEDIFEKNGCLKPLETGMLNKSINPSPKPKPSYQLYLNRSQYIAKEKRKAKKEELSESDRFDADD